MRPVFRHLLLAPAVVIVAVVVAACTSDGPSGTSAESETATPEQTITVPPSRLTPFCQAMIDLSEQLETDPPDDVELAILDAYEAIATEVPDSIREDFDAVLSDLRGGSPATSVPSEPTSTTSTTSSSVAVDDFLPEGRLPGDTPVERVNEYVDFECRANQNNPGPPATQPLSAAPTSEP